MRSPRRGLRDSTETVFNKDFVRAEFRPHNGVATLHLDGKPTVPFVVDVTANTSGEDMRQWATGGARLFRLRNVELGWEAANRSELGALDARVHALREAAPEAVFLLEVNVEAPDWWRRANKAECAVFCLARPRPEPGDARENAPHEERAQDNAQRGEGAQNTAPRGERAQETSANEVSECASRASRRWMSEAGDALARLAQHVAQAEWGANCIGFQVAGGENGDWRHPEWARMPDVGPRMAEAFRAFCVDKYRRNAGLLKKGWDDPRADFDRIKCPDAYERRYADVGNLRDPLRSRRMLDYYECFYTAQNQAALHFCSVLKRTGGGRIVGLAYASPLGTITNAEGGWGQPEAVFDSEQVDYLVAAPSQSDAPAVATFLGSLKLRGKFVFLSAREYAASADAGMALTHAMGALFPASVSPEQRELLWRAGARNLNAPAPLQKRGAQVALIVDAFASAYFAGKDEARMEWERALWSEQWEELNRTGAQMETYLLSDLFHPRFPDHKVTVFLNTLYLSEAERRRIDARVKRSGQTAIWLWGAGLLSETGIEAEAAGKLIGMKLRMEKNATSLRTRIVEGNDPLTWGLHVGATVGPERAVIPTLTVADKGATRLGANSANKTVFAARRNPEWTSVHFGTVPVSAVLLRNVLSAAGIHLYVDGAATGTIVAANARLVTIYSRRGGKIKVSLPGLHEITDARDRKPLAVASDVELTLVPGETRLLELKPRQA